MRNDANNIRLPDKRERGQVVESSWETNRGEKISFDGQDFFLVEPLKISAAAHWVEEGLLSVNLRFGTKVRGSCIRCLENAELEISDELLYLYSSCGQVDKNDEMVVEIKNFGKTLDIAEQVWESLVLSLPRGLLCSEACKGLCSSCGANLN